MLTKILSASQLSHTRVLKFKFATAISWKRIKQKMHERQKYYKDYEMGSNSLRIDQEKYKIYIAPVSPEVVRTEEFQYRILGNPTNFNITFLQNLDYMGKQFTWNNRKGISISFRDIFKLQSVSKSNPITIVDEYISNYNNEATTIQKQLKIQFMEDGLNLKLSLRVHSKEDQEKVIEEYEISWNDYILLVEYAKKNIYYSSGLKTMLEMQKRQIVRLMDKRVINNQEKPLKSAIEYDLDQQTLLNQLEDDQRPPQQIKPKYKKKNKQTEPK